jgi:hypothetical protein
MKMSFLRAAVAAATLLVISTAGATYNTTVDGHVISLSQMTSEMGFTDGSIAFSLDGGPATPCVANGLGGFIVSSNTVSSADARKNIMAILLSAKMAGTTVRVGYDSSGAYCDQNHWAVYWVGAL